MMCDTCRHADAVGGFPDGEDMFCCNRQEDPRIPFDMEEDTVCPLWEEAERCRQREDPTVSATSRR